MDHVRLQAPQLENVRTYPEYPGGGSGKHPMTHWRDLLADEGLLDARLVADLDDPTPIQPGMVLSVEPGLYVPELGGFRHSDTVVVTERGCGPLSLYPRELAELVVSG